MEFEPKRYTPLEALNKARNWCARQERAQQDARDKLYGWGLTPDEVEEAIASLISENYLNEERYARAYVSGLFRIKNWGRVKIVNGLKQKRISGPCVRLGLQEIDETEYVNTLDALLQKKGRLSNLAVGDFSERQKLAAYLIRKGYEPELVWSRIQAALDREEKH